MTDIPRQYGIADDPTQAFESLRQEISLLHTAIQGLTAREKYRITVRRWVRSAGSLPR